MHNDKVNLKRRRRNDFPELQVGYPERNDVTNPDNETERIHVDDEKPGKSRKRPGGGGRGRRENP